MDSQSRQHSLCTIHATLNHSFPTTRACSFLPYRGLWKPIWILFPTFFYAGIPLHFILHWPSHFPSWPPFSLLSQIFHITDQYSLNLSVEGFLFKIVFNWFLSFFEIQCPRADTNTSMKIFSMLNKIICTLYIMLIPFKHLKMTNGFYFFAICYLFITQDIITICHNITQKLALFP